MALDPSSWCSQINIFLILLIIFLLLVAIFFKHSGKKEHFDQRFFEDFKKVVNDKRTDHSISEQELQKAAKEGKIQMVAAGEHVKENYLYFWPGSTYGYPIDLYSPAYDNVAQTVPYYFPGYSFRSIYSPSYSIGGRWRNMGGAWYWVNL